MRCLNLIAANLLAALALSACGPGAAELGGEGPEEEGLGAAELSAAGERSDYDPGPAAGNRFAELFAAVPNYRAVAKQKAQEWLTPDADGKTKLARVNEALVAQGKEPIPEYTLTGEKFRYEMGPVLYRGRLDGTAKVLVVGQDASTDEALVHRAFIGGTGQKVQGFLASIGINRSYLCLNTFIYSIYGQFDPYAEELATSTAIRAHRSQLFEQAYASGALRLVLSFGNAAHTSVRNWLDDLHGGQLPAGLVWVRMLHPGMAGVGFDPDNPGGNSDALDAVIASFTSGWWKVWNARRADPSWLSSDPGGRTYQGSKFYYSNADVPFRDLPYGRLPWLGRGGTTSERGTALRVQLRSPNGVRYQPPSLAFPFTASKWSSGYSPASAEELAWEPPKVDAATRHDSGPGAEWAALFAKTPTQAAVAAEAGVAVANDFDQPVWHRGDLVAPTLLVLAQDTSLDSFVAGRALTGDDGQHLEELLARAGAKAYALFNVYPYATGGLAAESVAALGRAPSLAAHRQALLAKLLAQGSVKGVLTVGEGAREAFGPLAAGFSGTWIHVAHPKDSGAYASFNAALTQLRAKQAELGLSGGSSLSFTSSTFANARRQVPRAHLPYGAPLWLGTSGDLTQQPSSAWLFWNAPRWLSYEAP